MILDVDVVTEHVAIIMFIFMKSNLPIAGDQHSFIVTIHDKSKLLCCNEC
jgi:hypothetical protein